ncbi:MAG: enoyl-CoA hydratase-related protein [Planctomycetota bacterium]
MYSYIQTEFSDGVGRLTLNRPDKRNALKREFIAEIQSGLSELQSNPELRVFILAANGSVFCAGMDLGEMQQRAQSENGKAEWQRDSEIYCEVLNEIFSMPVPTIAAVSGPALAGGMGMVLACDLLIASDNAFFMLPEPMRGITAAMVTPLLLHRVGAGPATYLLLSGEKVSANKGQTIGLCHDVVSTDEFEPRIHSLVQSILTGSQSALAITKKHINDCVAATISEQIEMSVRVSAEARETDDAREGLAAFLEKRKPKWQAN